MNRLILATSFIFIVASIVTAFCYIQAHGFEEPLKVNELSHFFGTLRQGTTDKAVFHLQNVGQKEIEISRVLSSCSCTVTEIPNKRIMPGGSTPLEVEFSTGIARGNKKSDILVSYYVDGEDQSYNLPLSIKAFVEPDVDFIPKQLVFTEGVTESKTVILKTKYIPKLEITETYCTQEAFNVIAKTFDSKDNSCQVEVKYDSNRWTLKNGEASLKIKTNSINEPIIRIPIIIVEPTQKLSVNTD